MKTSLDQTLNVIDSNLSEARMVLEPFPHSLLSGLLDKTTAEAMLDWLENDAPWKIESRRFYLQHGCDRVNERVADSPAAILGTPETFQTIRKHLERIFNINLDNNRFELAAHRLLPGHRIGIHNDNPIHGTETHRFLINLNSQFEDSHGGHLVLFDLSNPSESAVILRPIHNSAVAMEFSERSWHYVDEVKTGKRYSLIYSFWTQDAASHSEDDEVLGDGPPISEDKFQELVEFLREIGANSTPHSSRFLIDHLTGIYRLLESWQCDSDVCKAGLFHSVMGTQSFPVPLVSEDRIDTIRHLIGERAALLVRLFKRIDVTSLINILADGVLLDGGEPAMLGSKDQKALVILFWANAFEQSPYAPYSFQETAQLKELYEKTVDLLPLRSHDDIRRMLTGISGSQGRA